MIVKVGIIVGEVSGDALGASLIQALQTQNPQHQFQILGILGPKLIHLGGISLFPMEILNVMGLFEPLKRLPQLWQTRRALLQHFIQDPPDIFIGVDAPDFNLGIEQRLREKGIKTVHYVSPTIWAWRQKRIHQIKNAVDLMLAIFPFEKKIYDTAGIPCCFVGHPFADQIPLEIDTASAKTGLGYQENDSVIAILPGSRNKELHYLASRYLETAQHCFEVRPDLRFVVPVVSSAHEAYILQCYQELRATFPIKVVIEKARQAMAACDVALVTSGTATLEVMLHKKPMLVGYRMNPVTYQIAKRLVKLPYIAMANIVAGEKLAPEFIQSEVNPTKMAKTLLDFLTPSQKRAKIIQRYYELHQGMRKNASSTAAKAIMALLPGLSKSQRTP